MTNQEWIQLFFSKSYENQVNELVLEDIDYEVPIESLMNYVQNLLDIPYSEFLNNLPLDDHFSLTVRDLPEFDSITFCTKKLVEHLQENDNRGIYDNEYPVISYNSFNEPIYGKNGSKYLKTAAILGLTYKYYNTWYLNCLGYVYLLLDDQSQNELLARSLLRSRFYRRLIPECIKQKNSLHHWLPNYSNQYLKRYVNSVNMLLKYCQEEAYNCNIKIYSIDEIRIKNKPKEAIEKTSLDIYRKEIRKFENLSIEECVELAQRIRKGDVNALHELVSRNLRYAFHQARHYTERGLPIEDLVQEASIGLIHAADKYDETQGFMFASYSQQWIALEIQRALAEYSSLIRIPQNKLQLYRKFKKYVENKCDFAELPLSLSECHEATGLSEDVIMEFQGYPTSLCEFDEEFDLETLYANEEFETDYYSKKEYLSYITRVYLSLLNERQRKIIKMQYGIGYPYAYTLDAIAKELNLTRERVRQISVKGIRRIKSILGIIKKHDKYYVGISSDEIPDADIPDKAKLHANAINEIVDRHQKSTLS